MTIIKAETKKGQDMIERAKANLGNSLYSVYSSFSKKKADALQKCKVLCYEEKGKNFRIISANTFQFSVAWETPEGTRIETVKNSYLVC